MKRNSPLTPICRVPWRWQKYLFACVALVSMCPPFSGAAQEWAIRAGGAQSDVGRAIAADPAGNIYVAGHFQSSATFGSGASAVMLTAAGASDVFLAKYDGSSNLVWVVKAGGPLVSVPNLIEQAGGVAVDGQGNVFLTGWFHDNGTFTGGTNTVLLTSAGAEDMFLAKYSSAGGLLWVKRIGGEHPWGDVTIGGVAADAQGNAYLFASLRGSSVTIGGSAPQTTLPTADDLDDLSMFLIKFAPDGVVQWFERGGSDASDSARGIALDSTGNIHVVGEVLQATNAAFGKGTNTVSLSFAGTANAVLVKYATNGNVLWARSTSSADGTVGVGDVAVDTSDNVYLTGWFTDPITFGTGVSAVTITNVRPFRSDGFLAKYSSAGDFVWAQAFGSDLDGDASRAVALDSSGNVWAAGVMFDTIVFGSGSGAMALYGVPGAQGFGTAEGFLVQFSGAGVPLSAFKIGASNGTPTIRAVVAHPSVYAAGSFSGTAIFNSFPGLRLTTAGASDMFLARYGAVNLSDIALRAGVDKPAPPQGDTITFTVTVTNRGPSIAGLVRVVAVLPVGLSSVAVIPSRGTYATITGVWDIGFLTNNTSATLTVSGVAGHSSPITLTAKVSHSDRVDTVVTNNIASATSQALLPPGSSLVVTNTQNGGLGSLRNAIEFANSKTNSGGPDVISFAIPAGDPGRDAGGVCTIRLAFPLPPLTEPVIIDGLTQSGANNASWPPALKVMIAGTNTFLGGNGLHLAAGNSTLRGIAIDGFRVAFDNAAGLELGGAGIYIEGPGSNTITCNFIGTDTTGTNVSSSSTRQKYGVRMVNSPNNTIGGTNVSLRNLIADNDDAGIRIEHPAATNNVMLGNFIGTTVTGMTALENGVGIEILDAPRNIIGTTNHSAGVCDNGCNLISGNDEPGILIDGFSSSSTLAAGQIIVGNFIGVNLTGTNALRNEDSGIVISEKGGGHIIGSASDPGVCSKGCNLISGNQFDGLLINDDAHGNVVQGNFIGTDATGARAVANGDAGLEIWSSGNFIGGTSPGLGNLISGNAGEGLDFVTPTENNVIQGNLIGVAINGTSARGNGSHGISFAGLNYLIGGTNAAERNVIAFNSGHGIEQGNLIGAPNFGNRYVGNLIYGNSGLAIDLMGDGLTANDLDESDTGANELQNYPVLDSIPTMSGAGSTTVSGTLQSKPSTSYRIEFFASPTCDASKFGEAQAFIGAIDVMTSPGGTANFNPTFATPGIAAGWVVTTTATGPDGTSEFSQCADFPSRNIVTNTANSGAGSLRDALLFASINPGPDAINFNIPTNVPGWNPTNGVWRLNIFSALPVINHPVIIDGTTQPGANCDQWPPLLKIELPRGLQFIGNSNVVRGLIINSTSTGLSFDGIGNVVQCNFIGTDASGTQRRPNSGAGVHLGSNPTDVHNRIGGPLPTQRNLISASGTGITFFNSSSNIIENNFIGTDVTGTTNLGNNAPGVNVSSHGNVIRNNLVSGNGLTANPAFPDATRDMTSDSGIFIRANDNVVQGNFVGTDVTGTLSLSNRGSGIEIMGGHGNLIGGTTAGAANRIAFNGDDGIELQAQHPNIYPFENRLLGNSIFSNTRLGIDLGDNGVSANDSGAGDVDQFWNQQQNFPEITSAGYDTNANQLVIDYRVTTHPLNSAYPLRIEFFRADAANQEGQVYLGADEFTTADFTSGTDRTAVVTALSSVAVLNRIVATATDASGNTSEFSMSALLAAAQAPPKLNIVSGPAPGTISIRWPSAAANSVLHTKTNLNPAVQWTAIGSGIVDDGTWKTYALSNSPDRSRFFRLMEQP